MAANQDALTLRQYILSAPLEGSMEAWLETVRVYTAGGRNSRWEWLWRDNGWELLYEGKMVARFHDKSEAYIVTTTPQNAYGTNLCLTKAVAMGYRIFRVACE